MKEKLKSGLERKLILTADGSHTLHIPELNEHYHSDRGAIQESMHVFIEAGLRACKPSASLTLFEVGFGTGLNAWLTLLEAKQLKQKTHYISIEKYPLTANEYTALNYPEQHNSNEKEAFMQLHRCAWNQAIKIDQYFTLTKLKGDLLQQSFSNLPCFDLVYFDAFGPDKHRDLWQAEVFEQLYAHSNTQAVLVTYSAKGSVRRMLQAAGYLVERLQGPPGKREMLRGIK
ncbi:tRNA (5-methylaminomethyl-2-thiouridine)(34)-methyltransferase MnmD [Roseimarinus sediminis]|jgi:tRNA U34 5-methylaminomethyl-2-thiouridine-forming methyltransferase MnmC|uniref:tRNA (5-methylaminomethyl-2-thiouridine)(34)-methyltransferase MnmD n=1 Tax=Roseimarinus sediminis TaxID=1610899 RepID=UPI003D1ED661